MATPRYLSANNGFLPVATQQVVAFIRDPAQFKINRYVQNVRSPGPNAAYMKLDRHHPARVTSDAIFRWADGDKSPSGHHNLANFSWQPFQTERRAYPFTMGNQAVKAAQTIGGWDPAAAHAKIVAQQAITNRTNQIITTLETVANWPTANTAEVSALTDGGGAWDNSSSIETDANFCTIKKSLMEAMLRINKGTNAKVQFSDMRLLISPGCAAAMSNTGEIHAYMKSSSHSRPVIEGMLGNPNEQWGLPAHLYGFEIIVEDCVIVTDKPYVGDSTEPAHAYVKADDTALLVTRQGALDAPFGAPNFSTIQCYWYSERSDDGGELEIEVRTDDWNRFMEGRCVEQFCPELAAAPTGFLFQNVLSGS